MINRTLLRIKAVQLLYAYMLETEPSLSMAETELSHSIKKTYALYYQSLLLPIAIVRYAQQRIENAQQKFCPTEEEMHPNLKFVKNLWVAQLSENEELNQKAGENNNWTFYPEVIKSLYEQIISEAFYGEYMSDEENDYEADKMLWRKIYTKIIPFNSAFYESIEEQSIYWNDDVEMILSFVIKTIKHFKLENGTVQHILEIEDNEDYIFAKELFDGAVKNKNEYLKLVEEAAKNWEIERLAHMDTVIMLMAISEFMHFPTIPITVTINEYIEIAKSYSSEKSSGFINGILDKIAEKLKKEKKLLKVAYVTPK